MSELLETFDDEYWTYARWINEGENRWLYWASAYNYRYDTEAEAAEAATEATRLQGVPFFVVRVETTAKVWR